VGHETTTQTRKKASYLIALFALLVFSLLGELYKEIDSNTIVQKDEKGTTSFGLDCKPYKV
jgi:hypothetical protein